jgi:hypothetical protein
VKRWSLVVSACVCALTAAGTSAAARPKPKPRPKPLATCTKVLPFAAANSVTQNAYALTKVVAKSSPTSVSCEYDNADWPGPQGTADAVSFSASVANAATRKFYARVATTYPQAAARNAARANCQPGFPEPPLADFCQVEYPFGPSSIELSGYLYVLTHKFLFVVARGGADYTPEGLQAIARTVMARLH